MPGTILAGDGYVASINAPTKKDLDGLDLTCFRNRKGVYALIVQAFCDAYCRFRYFEVAWPGCTCDITAYRQTELFRKFEDGKIPSQYHMVLDEAYSGIGGSQHLTPFSRAQLRGHYDNGRIQEYEKMKCFNYQLSGQRITIERSFGIFVKKWGILWKPLGHSLSANSKILKVCAKLHNFSLNSFIKRLGLSESSGIAAAIIADENDLPVSDTSLFANTHSSRFADNDIGELLSYAENTLESPLYATRISAKKQFLVGHIFDKGFMYDLKTDTDFTLRR